MSYGDRNKVAAGDTVELLVDEIDDHLLVWFNVGDTVQASATVIPLLVVAIAVM